MAGHAAYLRRDLPDGHADLLLQLSADASDAAALARADGTSRYREDMARGLGDASRSFDAIAGRLSKLAKADRLPG